MRHVLFAAILASFAGAADAQTWAQRPTAEEFQREYPPEALEAGVEAVVVLHCLSMGDGRLSACVPISEEPAGWGFANAALRLSRLYRLHQSVFANAGSDRVQFELEIAFPRRE
jgi:periplasmic protein TonB